LTSQKYAFLFANDLPTVITITCELNTDPSQLFHNLDCGRGRNRTTHQNGHFSRNCNRSASPALCFKPLECDEKRSLVASNRRPKRRKKR